MKDLFQSFVSFNAQGTIYCLNEVLDVEKASSEQCCEEHSIFEPIVPPTHTRVASEVTIDETEKKTIVMISQNCSIWQLLLLY